MASNGYGVAYYTDSLYLKINEKDGLQGKQFNDLTVDGDTLWVSTNSGLNKLVFNTGLELQTIEHFNTNNGLSSNEVAGTECSKNKVFISTSLGYDIINRTDLKGKEDEPYLHISYLRSIRTDSSYVADIQLGYKESDIGIKYNAIQYNTNGHHSFRYRLLPQSEIWKETTKNELEFYNLNPKFYTFEVEIKNNQGHWVSKNKMFFTINPPFWNTWWFTAISIATIVLSIVLILKRREKKYREKIEIENELRRLKGKALRAQVNPHFYFQYS